MAFALDFVATLYQFLGEALEVQARADAAINLSTEQGFSYWLPIGRVLHGWALTEQGQSINGIEQIRQGVMAYRATGAGLFLTYFLGLLADALSKDGNASEALTVLSEALDLVEETGERYYEAELYRLKGKCLLGLTATKVDVQQEAETCFQKALAIARRQGAHLLLWKVIVSLAQLRIQQGRMEDAHQLLSEACSASTEGVELAPIMSAKALLAQLNKKT